MKKQITLMAVLSTAAVMTVVTPNLTTTIPGFVQNALAATQSGWIQDGEELRYMDSDGYYLTDSWKKKDGDWYYLNEEGYVTRSTMVDEYYVNESGKRIFDQWIGISNEDEWDDDAPDMYWYYFGKNGKSVVSKFQSIEDKWYYFNDEGQMQTGKLELDGSIYYLGKEGDGIMKTGWIQLEHESDDLEEDMVWHFFDSNGKMVMNQVDRKISGNHYTFEHGILQTGWYSIPKTADETASASDATSTAPAIASYQFYEEDGKRASGWYQMEGAPDISEEGETYTFYFKNGKPHHADNGVQTFAVDSKKYGFNTKGEMQIGLQTVTLEDGDIANFYFGSDGVMKTGKQTIYNEDFDENQTWFFLTDGGNKGQGFHGVRDNSVYRYGLRLDANRDLRYAPVELDGTLYLVNTNGAMQKASSTSKSISKPELGNGYKDVKDANEKTWTVNTNGVVQN